jgi:serine/arginine repetitive matrix protein 2
MEKRKHDAFQGVAEIEEHTRDSPKRPHIIEKASVISTSSSKFGGERMIKAQKGILQRLSLEESALIAEGEDTSGICELLSHSLLSDFD